MPTYDVVIIGAGHDELVCAAYLLKAGYSVALLEKRAIPGGGATTEEAMPKEAPGFKFNLCAIDHEFIHLGPVVAEIAHFNKRDAEKYGEFIDFWQRLTKDITPIFNAPPKSGLNIAGNYGLKNVQDLLSTIGAV